MSHFLHTLVTYMTEQVITSYTVQVQCQTQSQKPEFPVETNTQGKNNNIWLISNVSPVPNHCGSGFSIITKQNAT